MSFNNRTFKDNRTGEVVKVIDSFENIAILENKTKIDTRRLMDPNHFTEQVDPSAFFNTQNAYNDLFEKIKTIPSENIPDENGEVRPNVNIDNNYRPPVEDDSAVIYGSIDDEKEELARKYGINPDNTQSVARQNEAFAKILEDSEELDITDLVTTQKDTQSKQDEYFENLFGQLGKLESRLGEMDAIMNKLNALENKIEKYREKTPQERLELRSYDSYPFNQKLSQFFDDKSEEMEKTGKNDYVLTPDDVTDINVNDIKNSFQNKSNGFEDEFKYK